MTYHLTLSFSTNTQNQFGCAEYEFCRTSQTCRAESGARLKPFLGFFLDLERLISNIATEILKKDRESMYQSEYMYIGPLLSPFLDQDVARPGISELSSTHSLLPGYKPYWQAQAASPAPISATREVTFRPQTAKQVSLPEILISGGSAG